MDIKKKKMGDKVKVLVVTGDNKITEANLLANKVNERNHLSVIEYKCDGKMKVFFTGGIILEDTEEVRDVIKILPQDRLFKVLSLFKIEPFVKRYYEEVDD